MNYNAQIMPDFDDSILHPLNNPSIFTLNVNNIFNHIFNKRFSNGFYSKVSKNSSFPNTLSKFKFNNNLDFLNKSNSCLKKKKLQPKNNINYLTSATSKQSINNEFQVTQAFYYKLFSKKYSNATTFNKIFPKRPKVFVNNFSQIHINQSAKLMAQNEKRLKSILDPYNKNSEDIEMPYPKFDVIFKFKKRKICNIPSAMNSNLGVNCRFRNAKLMNLLNKRKSVFNNRNQEIIFSKNSFLPNKVKML